MRNCYIMTIVAALIFISACSSSKKIQKSAWQPFKEIKFISEYVVPNGAQFKGTTVGGLSGIDYDIKRDQYYLICDDPSAINPTRFYTAKILIGENGIDSVLFTEVDTLLNKEGKPFANIRKDRIHSADAEALRYDPTRDEMIWSSEGQRVINDSTRDLQNPSIIIADRLGKYKDSFALPANMKIQTEEKGPRHNSVFEGLSFDEDYSHVFVNVEEPLYEDGSKAGTGDSTAVIHILKFNRKLKQCVAQFAYEIGAVPYPANPPSAFKINGVPDILYLGDDKFIVIERAFSTGRIPTDVKIYLADAADAEDVLNIPSLKDKQPLRLIKKQLLLDMNNSLGLDIFNIEGVCFGPKLSNGNRSLLLVTDNNFNAKEKTQFFLFEVLP